MAKQELGDQGEKGPEDMTVDEIKAKLIEVETELHRDLKNPLNSRMSKEREDFLINQRHQYQDAFKNLTGRDFGSHADDYPDSMFSD
jgi:hypothetical protein